MAIAARTLSRTGLARPAQGWLPIILLVALVMSVVYSIDQAQWAANTGIMFPFAALGIAVGAWLCNRKVHSAAVLAIGVVVGGIFSFVIVSEAFPGPSDLLPNFIDMFRQTLGWVGDRRAGIATGPQPLAGALTTSWEFVVDLAVRLVDWFDVVSSFRASADNVIFLLWMAYAAWGMGFIGAWGLYRRRSVAIAALGAAIGLAINVTYIGPTRLPFIIFMVALLLLMVQVNLFALSDRWDKAKIEYSAELRINITALSLVLVALVTLFAVFFPRIRGNPLSDSFWTYMGDGWGNVEAAANRLFSGVSNPSGASSLSGPQQLPIGAVLPFTKRATLIVQSTHEAYWRGVTYDRFFGDRWENTDKALTARDPGQALTRTVELRSRIAVKANIEILDSNTSVLFIPGDLVTMSRKYLIQSSEQDDVSDFSSIRATRSVGRRIAYSVESTIPGPSIDALRNARTSYPAWIDKYLQLPDVSPRVKELAARFATSGDNAFDRAQRIEFFLRRYPFSIEVPEPAPGTDVVDQYLFELRRGYADYTASAMAVLARLNGIPTRVVAGYVPGTFDEETGRFIAGPEDSHIWVEVFFPAFGWIPFEPSGYRVPLIRQEGGSGFGGANPGDLIDIYDLEALLDDLALGSTAGDFDPIGDFNENPILQFIRSASGVFIVVGGIVGTVIGGFVLYFLIGFATTRFQSPKTRIHGTYRRMLKYSRWAGYNPGEARTPLELAQSLSEGLYPSEGETETNQSTRVFLEEDRPPVEIARQYARALYSDHGVLPIDRRSVDRAWKRLRPRLLGRIIRRRKILAG